MLYSLYLSHPLTDGIKWLVWDTEAFLERNEFVFGLTTENKGAKRMKKVMFVTTTSTFANKGKDALRLQGIRSDVKRVQGGTATGCLFGITVLGENRTRTEKILRENGVRVISVRDAVE